MDIELPNIKPLVMRLEYLEAVVKLTKDLLSKSFIYPTTDEAKKTLADLKKVIKDDLPKDTNKAPELK